MATSGSTDFSVTRDNILTDALLKIQAIGENETPTISQLNHAARQLNMLTKFMSAYQIPLWALKTTSTPLLVDKATYTIGIGGDINVARPLKIVHAWTRVDADGNDTPLRQISQHDYEMFGNKTSKGTPSQFWYDPQLEKGVLTLYPVPDITGRTLFFRYHRPFEDFDAANDTPDFPQEWYIVLVHGLAALLAPDYGVPADEAVILWQTYQRLFDQVDAFDREPVGVRFQPDLQHR